MMDYQEKRAVETQRPTGDSPFRLAVVTQRSGYTYTLQFDGEDTAKAKYYKGPTAYTISVGSRVLCARVSGTYIVICAI